MRKTFAGRVLIGPSSFAEVDAAPKNKLLDAGFEIIDNPFKRKLTQDELLNLLKENVTGIIAGLEPLNKEVLQQSNLKVISRVGSGLSNVDLAAAEELGVKVCSTPFGPTTAVVELTIGVILSLLRGVPQMDRALHQGKWQKMIGGQLQGKTVVIVGFGRIGSMLAKKLSVFHVKIIAVDPNLEEGPEDITLMSLSEALPLADIITFHSSGEECILAEKEFLLIKSGAYLINAARGGLISEGALVKGLESGTIAGAWLDTFSYEPYDGPLTKFDQVVLTPHIGSYTAECRKQMEMEAVDNLISSFVPK